MWQMETNVKSKSIKDHGFSIMKYPHHHGTCKDFGHWNPEAQAYRDYIKYLEPMHNFDLEFKYDTHIDELTYCPKGICEKVVYSEKVIPGTMWGEWPEYVQGKALVMHEKHADGSYGEAMACCNIYHYKIKELTGNDPH